MKRIKSDKPKTRNINIIKCAQGELNLGTRCTTPNKRAYKRKDKHAAKRFDY